MDPAPPSHANGRPERRAEVLRRWRYKRCIPKAPKVMNQKTYHCREQESRWRDRGMGHTWQCFGLNAILAPFIIIAEVVSLNGDCLRNTLYFNLPQGLYPFE